MKQVSAVTFLFAVLALVLGGWQYLETHPISPEGGVHTVRANALGNATIGVGSSVKLEELTVTLNRVVNDYRCPENVQCIQAGGINANLTLSTPNQSETHNLYSDRGPYSFDGYIISITNTTPPTHTHVEIPPSAYRVTFHIE